MRQRVLDFLTQAKGRKFSARQIAEALRIDPGPRGQSSEALKEMFRVLAQLKDQGRISSLYPTPDHPEFVYWIEPPLRSSSEAVAQR